MASKWRWIKQNWPGLTLLWFNAVVTVIAIALALLMNWGVGLIFFLSSLVAAWLLLWCQTTPLDGGHADIIIKLTDRNVFRDEHGCYCNYCGSSHPSLERYRFDPSLHLKHCIVPSARLAVDPGAIEFESPVLEDTSQPQSNSYTNKDCYEEIF